VQGVEHGGALEDVPPEQLVLGIRSVASSDALLALSITKRVVDEYVRRLPETAHRADPDEAVPHDRVQAVVYAYETGVVQPSS
jgi:hypothetical protein